MRFTALVKKYSPLFIGVLLILILILYQKFHQKEEIAPVAYVEAETKIETETSPETETETETETTIPETETTETETIPETSEPPESVLIEDVPYYSQEDLLPTGCEIVSAKMLLDYYTGKDSDIEDIIDLLNCQFPQEINDRVCAPHPENAFIGNPLNDSGFGCFAPIIVKALNRLLPKNYKAEDISGEELSEIAETYLPKGQPVLVWATICMWNTSVTDGWYILDTRGNPTNIWYDWYVNEHCMVLVGYDETKYYFNDPYGSNGLIAFNRKTVEDRYEKIGKYAAVVVPKPKTKSPKG